MAGYSVWKKTPKTEIISELQKSTTACHWSMAGHFGPAGAVHPTFPIPYRNVLRILYIISFSLALISLFCNSIDFFTVYLL